MSQFENPYAPPEADEVEPPASEGHFVVGASQSKRLVNMVVDTVASRVLVVAFLVPARGQVDGTTATLIDLLMVVGYYVFFELAFQATPGKFLTGTRVITLSGGRPTFMQILGRTLSRVVPFEPFSFFSSRYPVGWHDRWSNTRVVDKHTRNRLRS